MSADTDIVGHKTFSDGADGFRHEPLTRAEGDAILKECEEAEKKRAEQMPDEKAALHQMFQAYTRLKDLGWREASYCPKDGSVFNVIEAGSTGIFRCHYDGEWPKGTWWVHDDGDLWPSRPILFKPDQTGVGENLTTRQEQKT
jgi:hypothetical protein